jgi:hypothetical protein
MMVPTRWVKAVIGVSLLPACWLTLATFCSLLVRTTLGEGFWKSEEFWFFMLGFLLWLIAFTGFSRQFLFLYVTGHEFTHAVWVWLMGGRVTRMELGADGGEIHVSKTNFLIALAPYFFPIYTVVLLVMWIPLGTIVDLSPARSWFCLLLGISWGFHFTYTIWMIPREQTDLLDHGLFFSLVVIILMNLFVMSLLLIVASPDVTPASFWREWLQQGVNVTEMLERFVAWLPG